MITKQTEMSNKKQYFQVLKERQALDQLSTKTAQFSQ